MKRFLSIPPSDWLAIGKDVFTVFGVALAWVVPVLAFYAIVPPGV